MIRSLLAKFNLTLPPLPTAPPAHEPDRTTLLQLSAIIAIAVLTHFSIAHPVIASVAVLVFILKLAIIFRHKSAPHNIVMMFFTIFSLGLILFFYGGWNGKTAGISFLVLLVALKFLESRKLRDYYVVCLLLYFLAASTFLFDSSLISIASIVVYTIAITAILFKISNPTSLPWFIALKESGFLIIKALPLAILLFFFFPRIQGSFGFIPSQDQSSGQGLENSLVAGEMASSAFDNSIAFRAEFSGPMPLRTQLYWRSKVMPVERNFQWEILPPERRDRKNALEKQRASTTAKSDYRYEILHEKTRDLFIPYLESVTQASRGSILSDYSVYLSDTPLNEFSYKGGSSLTPALPEQSNINQAQYLNTLSKPSARLQALLAQWRQQASSNRELVQLVYQHFSQEKFNYSLTPPGLVEENPIDGFMFETQSGYCEHYASAFTILMRWLGIPARIVTGYQGGKLNATGQYLVVRYSDAHAWSEVWLDQRWQRVDPTAAISPERIEYGMDALQQLWDDGRFRNNLDGLALSNILNPTGTTRYLLKIRESWENIGYQWNKWVVNYDSKKQRELLNNLGFSGRNSVTVLIAIMSGGALLFMLFYFWQLIPRAVPIDEIKRIYLRFVGTFHKHNIDKAISDTPQDFLLKTSKQFPQQEREIAEIIHAYQALRYGRPTNKDDERIEQFKQLVKQFKLKDV